MEEITFRIAVCDDEKIHRDHLIRIIDKWSMKENVSCKISSYESGDALLRTGDTFDLIFLDILMDGKNGMQSAQVLREQGSDAKIVFTTVCSDFVFQGYEVEAYRYLMKPYRVEQITDILEKCYERCKTQMLLIRTGGTVYGVKYRDIFYVEAQGRNSVVMLEKDKIQSSMSISEIEQQLPSDRFFRCTRSFIVDLAHIVSVNRYEATLKNGMVIPVSRTLWAEFKEKVITYLLSI